ncbi:Crp/Fnr family transcriptional regulator [Flexithrix dorotheae]|uniref:Crp/Fnr family transcriptional regulator n=1 Tax=Flexithrix dorotheae TaxID=70993 RepID=UPI000376AF1E|nr:Crp/Fnr family transcriptional regulator [Flexithrix dorotheae]
MSEKLRDHMEKVISLTDQEFQLVFAHFTLENFKKNEFIFQQGDSVKYVYFIRSGLLKLVYIDDLGREHIVSFAMEDWWESDFSAFFNSTKASFSLKCLEPTTVFCLSLKGYTQLGIEIPQIERFFLQKSNAGFIASQQRILSLLSRNAKERYENLLKQYPTLPQRVSKTQLAAFLGVSRETLSRLYT